MADLRPYNEGRSQWVTLIDSPFILPLFQPVDFARGHGADQRLLQILRGFGARCGQRDAPGHDLGLALRI
jgi:hypothetical protein